MGSGGSTPEESPSPTFTTMTTHTPLTTTFTAPDDCWTSPYYVPGSTGWFKAVGETSSCFPPGFAFSETAVLYSPGICPAGWKSACQSYSVTEGAATAVQMASSTDFIVVCCPISMKCVPSETKNDWDWTSTMGCVSSYRVDTTSWFPDQTMVPRTARSYVKSMYQRPVMIMAPPTTTAPPVAHRTSNATAHAGLSKAEKAGISVGAVVGGAMLLGLVVFTAWRLVGKRARAGTTNDAEGGRPESSLGEPSDHVAAARARRHAGAMAESGRGRGGGGGGRSLPPRYEP